MLSPADVSADEVSALLRALVYHGETARARALQAALTSFLAAVNASAELLAVPPSPTATAAPAAPAEAAPRTATTAPLVPQVDWQLDLAG